MDAEQLLLDHPWIRQVGRTHLSKQASGATAVAEAEAEAKDAWHQVELEKQEADTAAHTMAIAKASLMAAKESGDSVAILMAEQNLADAQASTNKEKDEAELAEANATVMNARVQAEVEEAEAYIEEKEAVRWLSGKDHHNFEAKIKFGR